MLPEMRYIEGELIPMLHECAGKHEKSAQKQLRQWRGEKGVCSPRLTGEHRKSKANIFRQQGLILLLFYDKL